MRSDVAPLEQAVDHVRGRPGGHTILLYGDLECPYSRKAYLAIQRVERRLDGNVRFAFRHFPLTTIHPHALAAAAAAEAAALQGCFWEMTDLLYARQDALTDGELPIYAAELGLDVQTFDRDRAGEAVLDRIARDVESGRASGHVHGTPTLFVDGAVHHGPYGPRHLLDAIGARPRPVSAVHAM